MQNLFIKLTKIDSVLFDKMKLENGIKITEKQNIPNIVCQYPYRKLKNASK
jgi:hypothetical protein